MEEINNHNLNFRSGMLQSWNKFCFTTGYIEVSVSMPGRPEAPGLWPAAWTMGNLVSFFLLKLEVDIRENYGLNATIRRVVPGMERRQKECGLIATIRAILGHSPTKLTLVETLPSRRPVVMAVHLSASFRENVSPLAHVLDPTILALR